MKGRITLQPLRKEKYNQEGWPVFDRENGWFGHIEYEDEKGVKIQETDETCFLFENTVEFMVRLEDGSLVELDHKDIDMAMGCDWWDYYQELDLAGGGGKELDFEIKDGVASVVVPEVEIGKTGRGFALGKFVDQYGVECSIQHSSIATKECIWLGCDDLGLKEFKAYEGWKDVELPNTTEHHYSYNTRMHLSREDVKKLLPLLQRFAETGSLYPQEDESKVNS